MRLYRSLFPILALALVVACAPPPPTLGPRATTAFKTMQVIRALDEIRDIAIAAHETTPPLMTEQTTGTIVSWHKSLVIVVHAAQDGWPEVTLKALDQLEAQLVAADRPLIAPYVILVKTIIQEVLR